MAGVAALGTIAYLSSDAGRARLTREVVERTRALLAGELRIERIEGDLTSELIVRGIELTDREGRPAITIRSVRAHYSLVRLLWDRHLDALEIERPAVLAFTSSAGLNLAALIVTSPAEPEPPQPGPPPAFSIGSIRVAEGSFALDGSPWIEGLGMSLAMSLGEGGLELTGLAIETSGARLTAPRTVLSPTTLALATSLHLTAPAALLSRLASDPALAADLEADLSAEHRPLSAWTAHADGRLAGAPFSLTTTAAGDFSTVFARLSASGIDPHGVYLRAPRGRLDLVATAHLRSDRIALGVHGSGTLTATAAVLPGLRLAATATLAGGRVEFAGALESASGDRAEADGSLQVDPPALEATRVSARLGSLQPFLPPDLPLDGALSTKLLVSGPLDALRVRGQLQLRGLSYPELAIAGVESTLDLAGVPSTPRGRVSLHATTIRIASQRFAFARADVALDPQGTGTLAIEGGRGDPIASVDMQGNLQVSRGGASLQLARAELLYRDARISAAPASVRFQPGSFAIATRVVTPAGGMTAEAKLDPAAPLTGSGSIELKTEELSLSEVARLLPHPVRMKGRARFSIAGALGPQRNVTAELSVARLVVRGTAPVDGTVRLTLARGLIGRIALTSTVARLAAELESAVPDDPTRWTTDSVERVQITAATIDLAGAAEQLAALGGPRLALTGTASISARVRPAGDRFRIEARAELAAGALPAVLTASASIPRDPGSWDRIDHRALERAVLVIDPIDLAGAARLVGLAPSLAGHGTLEAHASAGLDRISVRLEAPDLRLAGLDETLRVALEMEAYQRRTHLVGVIEREGISALAADLTLGAGVGDLLEGAPIVQRAKLAGTVRLPGLPLAPLSELVERPDAFAGVVAGTATVAGTLSAPRAAVVLAGSGARIGAMDFPRLDVEASYAPGLVSANLDLAQGTGGSLHVRSKMALASRRIELGVEASRFSIDFLNDVVPERADVGVGGRLDASLSLSGTPEDSLGLGRAVARGRNADPAAAPRHAQRAVRRGEGGRPPDRRRGRRRLGPRSAVGPPLGRTQPEGARPLRNADHRPPPARARQDDGGAGSDGGDRRHHHRLGDPDRGVHLRR